MIILTLADEEEYVEKVFEEDTFKYFYKMWEKLDFVINPKIDMGTYSRMCDDDDMVVYGYKYHYVDDEIAYPYLYDEEYPEFDADTVLILYLNTDKLELTFYDGLKSKEG